MNTVDDSPRRVAPELTGRPVPVDRFGKDHWSTLAYVETRIVDHRGLLEHDRMRCSAARHPGMMRAKHIHDIRAADASRYPTIIKADATPGEHGRFGSAHLPDHDDYDCLTDLVAAGLLTATTMPVGPDADLIEQVDSAQAVWALTDRGFHIIAQLRRFKAEGGRYHDFAPRP